MSAGPLALAGRLAPGAAFRLRVGADALPLERLPRPDLRGLPAGARVALVLPNGPAFVGGLVACLRAGLSVVPLDPRLSPGALEARCRLAGAAARLEPDGLRPCGAGDAVPDTGSVVLFTSGSTGEGAGVALPAEALLAVVDSHRAALGVDAGARVLGALPWTHAFGFVLELLTALVHGGTVASVPPPELPARAAEAPPDVLCAVPRLLAGLDDATLRAVRGGIVGGAPVRGALRARLERTRLRVGYGQTECGPGVTLGEAGEWPCDDFLGRAVGCQAGLAALDDGAASLRVRGPNLALGTLARGPDGAPVLRPLPVDSGWLDTGDLASARDDGALVHEGRKDERFKLDNGRMVNPGPLERPHDGRLLLVGAGRSAVVPLVRGTLERALELPVPHLPPRPMPEAFWEACTTATGKLSRRRAEALLDAVDGPAGADAGPPGVPRTDPEAVTPGDPEAYRRS